FGGFTGVDNPSDDGVEPAAGLLQGRIHELPHEIDRSPPRVHQERRRRIAALDIEPPHHLAHRSVKTLEAQMRLLDLEEIIEQAPAADQLHFRHRRSFPAAATVYRKRRGAVWSAGSARSAGAKAWEKNDVDPSPIPRRRAWRRPRVHCVAVGAGAERSGSA